MKTYSVGEAAKAAHMTSETLRHYDRIGLVRPRKDEWTRYRRYTEQDIVRLHTVSALRVMGLPLREIQKVLAYDELEKIVDFLEQAEKKADEKIAALQYGKAKIRLARADYEKKLRGRPAHDGVFLKEFPQRVILLSATLQTPALETLWNYLGHFYDSLDAALRERFAFEDLAGVYVENGVSRLFALCVRYADTDGLRVLPGGRYLCAGCTEENRKEALGGLMRTARAEYGVEPAFALQVVVVSGILQWKYEIQVPLDGSGVARARANAAPDEIQAPVDSGSDIRR
ncbi:MAG TPA: MerR family transcriptional regulator [Candidatus Avichristensenella intestinipullorum]|uniref:MerR family transcriptional regulator n=1 Tax=Candidatus Avichristensenella intestinipullorum TaxID=2840693 RepID=A0A9D0YVL0_9FIRM|nr:MerR family transcriptional regulator [Candidatus Avichristensenella intestinipullorum]